MAGFGASEGFGQASTVMDASSSVCASGSWVQAYANYLKQYAGDYAAAGDPLTYSGPENEANLSTSYDSMQLTPAQTASLIDVLGPTMAGSGTQVECCATEGWNYAQQYAAAIEADPTASADTAVFTSHGYTEAPTTPLSGWTKPAGETEWAFGNFGDFVRPGAVRIGTSTSDGNLTFDAFKNTNGTVGRGPEVRRRDTGAGFAPPRRRH
jgi:O-glycosyl hydrolase